MPGATVQSHWQKHACSSIQRREQAFVHSYYTIGMSGFFGKMQDHA
jgi:hypothetical protein